jgi:hypothetical protein
VFSFSLGDWHESNDHGKESRKSHGSEAPAPSAAMQSRKDANP